jgi:hypothetical protein
MFRGAVTGANNIQSRGDALAITTPIPPHRRGKAEARDLVRGSRAEGWFNYGFQCLIEEPRIRPMESVSVEILMMQQVGHGLKVRVSFEFREA